MTARSSSPTARLADEKLVGWFRTNEPESFAEAAATSFNGTVTCAATPSYGVAEDSRE
jgi:hypothetical protein